MTLLGASILLSWIGVAPAKAATLQVPSGAYPTIQSAVNAAANGDTIVLADGTYMGSGNVNVVVNKAVTITSANGPTACVVDLQGTANSGMYLNPGGATGTLQIEGITFRNGASLGLYGFASTTNATFRVVNCLFEGFSGGASVLSDTIEGVATGSTTIEGCVFRNNNCIRVVRVQGTVAIRETLFEGNNVRSPGDASQLCYLISGVGSGNSQTVEKCQFLNNSLASTSPIYKGLWTLALGGDNPILRESEFRGNLTDHGGGALVSANGAGTVDRCTFVDNESTGDIGGLQAHKTSVSNCLFANNQASELYGALYGGGNSKLYNCTFVGNSAGIRSGGAALISAAEACIFWGNTSPMSPQIYTATSVSYSIVQGGYSGTGNLNVDPQFVDPLNGNYRLLATSPARDTGFNYAGLAATDLAGNSRLVNGIVDRGCYEFQGTNTLPTVSSSASTFELECDCGPSCTETHVAFNYADADGDALVAHWKIDNGPELTSNIAADGPPNTGEFTVTAHLGLGAHSIEFWVSDGEGDSNVSLVTVTVRDTTAASLSVPTGTLTLECHVDSFDPMAGVSANDACAGDLTTSIVVNNPVDTHVPGVYTVTYSVTDPSGNTTTATRTVEVVDTTPPEITIAGDPFVTIYCGAGWTDPGATAVDLCDGTLSVSVDSNVNPNMIGLYSVTYTATDAAGNSNSTTRYVRVIATVVGLENPMGALVLDGAGDPPLPEHAFKRGRTIPLKLKLLCGSTPLGEGQVSPPKITSLVRVGDAEDLTVLDLNSGTSNDNGPNFRWSDPHWIYNLSTKELTVGTYQITIEMPDGQVFVAAFVLK